MAAANASRLAKRFSRLYVDEEFSIMDRDDPENEAEARREEMANAEFAFDKLDFPEKGWIQEGQFKDLMLCTIATYSVEEDLPKLRSICRGRRLHRRVFLSWYEEWMFEKENSSGGQGRLPVSRSSSVLAAHLLCLEQPKFLDRDDAGNHEEALREEMANAEMAFDKIDLRGKHWVEEGQFKELMLSTNATYSVKTHRPRLLSMCRGGRLYRKAFLSWYKGRIIVERISLDEGQVHSTGTAAWQARDVAGSASQWRSQATESECGTRLSRESTKPEEERSVAAASSSGAGILGASSGGAVCAVGFHVPDAAATASARAPLTDSPATGTVKPMDEGQPGAAAVHAPGADLEAEQPKHTDGLFACMQGGVFAECTQEQKTMLSRMSEHNAELGDKIERQAELLAYTLQACENERRGDRTRFDDETRRFDAERKEFETERRAFVREIARLEAETEELQASDRLLASLPESSKQALGSLPGLSTVLEECVICSEVLLSGIGTASFGVMSYSCGCSHVRTLHVNCIVSMSSLNCPFCSQQIVVIAPSLMAQTLIRSMAVRKA